MKTQLKNIAAGLIFGLVASAGVSATAHPGLTGQLGQLEDGQLESLEVAKVQPTAFADSSSTQAIGLAFAMAQGQDDTASVVDVTGEVAAAGATADEGFGFGGSSNASDIISLKYGYMLASLPMLKGQRLKDTAAALAKLGQLNGMYSGEVARHLIAVVDSAERGDVDVDALARQSDGFVGSEIAEVCRRAAIQAMRGLITATKNGEEVDPARLVVSRFQLLRAIEDVRSRLDHAR